jgi:hypothetical protein
MRRYAALMLDRITVMGVAESRKARVALISHLNV